MAAPLKKEQPRSGYGFSRVSLERVQGRALAFLSRHDIIDINDVMAYHDAMETNKSARPMGSITIRNLDAAIKERLRVRAAENGHSMEAEARHILQVTLKATERPPGRRLYERIRARFEPLGGADDLGLPSRTPDREPPRFD